MQKEIERNQAARGIVAVHANDKMGSSPHAKPHVEFDDGTSLNYDGTIHDKGKGVPKPTRAQKKWLKKHGWRTEPEE